jgi:outer membrane murein-binding lipoprotein Lpp
MPSENSPSDSSSGPAGLPRWAAWGIGILVLFIVAFGVGYLAGGAPVGDLNERVSQLEDQVEDAEIDAERSRSEASAQQALSLLYQTMLAVDARNFGIANDRLEQVEGALGRTQPELLGIDADAFRSVQADISALDVRVAEDLAGQRSVLAALGQRLSDLIGG